MPHAAQKPCKGLGCPATVPIRGESAYCPKCADRRPLTPCRNSIRDGCANLAKPPNRYCQACYAAWQKTAAYMERRRLVDHARGSGHKRGYGVRWRTQRKAKLARDPLCQTCDERGVLVPAVEVHHLDGNPKNRDNRNLWSVCIDCHRRLDTARRRAR